MKQVEGIVSQIGRYNDEGLGWLLDVRLLTGDERRSGSFDLDEPLELDDDGCVEWLWRLVHSPDGASADCPRCLRRRRFHRVRKRRSYSCDHCGQHIHPVAGTVCGADGAGAGGRAGTGAGDAGATGATGTASIGRRR